MFKHLFPVLLFPLILLGAGCAPEPVVEVETTEEEEAAVLLLDGTYDLVVEESVVTWEGSKVVVETTHNGTVNADSGRLTVEGGEVTGGTVTVDMATIKSLDLDEAGGAKLDGHLKSADFFGVATHPAATFTITSVDGSAVTGTMTIKGIDREVSFDADIEAEGAEIGLEATLELDRTLWDVRYGSDTFFDELGDAVISDTFTIGLDLEFLNPDAPVVVEEAGDAEGEEDAEEVEAEGDAMEAGEGEEMAEEGTELAE